MRSCLNWSFHGFRAHLIYSIWEGTMPNPVLIPPQYAANGINWQCLSVQMEVPYTENYPNYYYGNVVCEGGNFAIGIALAAALIVVITPKFVFFIVLIIPCINPMPPHPRADLLGVIISNFVFQP
jgi:hypothetical protein